MKSIEFIFRPNRVWAVIIIDLGLTIAAVLADRTGAGAGGPATEGDRQMITTAGTCLHRPRA